MHRLLLLVPLLVSSAAFAQLSVTPTALPSAYQGTSYGASAGVLPTVINFSPVNLGVTGSSNQFTYSVFLGSLPPGVTLSPAGALRGAPTQTGNYNFTIAAVSNQGERVEQGFTIRVFSPFSLSRSTAVGASFRLPMQCPSLGIPYSYSAQGPIPNGLSVGSSSGWITGAVTGPTGGSTFRWFCNASTIQARVDVTIDVGPMPSLFFTGQVGATFSAPIDFPGGTGPFLSYAVASGELPPGLDLDRSTGVLSGLPTVEGEYSFVVQRRDAAEDLYLVAVDVEILEGLDLTITPGSVSVTAIQDGPPTMLTARVSSEAPSDSFTLLTSTTNGGRWLSVSPSRGTAPAVIQVKIDAAGLAPGRYVGRIDARSSKIDGPGGEDQMRVEILVQPAEPELSVYPRGIEEAFRLGEQARERSLKISNAGSGVLPIELMAATSNGGNWLSVNPLQGTASGASPATAAVELDPAGLGPGTYKGEITVSSPDAANSPLTVPVTMTVSGESGLIELAPRGLSFRMEQGSRPLPRYFFVQEAAGRSVDWQAQASTTDGGSWLAVAPSEGTTGAQPSADVAVNASRLAPGWYFGRIAVTSSQSGNSPQSLIAALRVEPRGTPLPPEPSERGLAFVSPPMLAPTLSRTLLVGNPTARVQTLKITSTFPGSPIFFSANVADPRTPAGGSVEMQVRVNASQLTAGVYRGYIDLSFTEGGPISRIEVLLVVSEGSSGGPLLLTEEGAAPARQSACTPTSLHAVVVEPGDNFRLEQGQPVPIEAFVVDDCGNVPRDAEVTASFTNGDDPIRLTRNRRGGYSGLWAPVRVSPQPSASIGEELPVRVAQQQDPEDEEDAQITIQANQINVVGGTQIGGSLSAAAGIPVISPGGAVSAASFSAHDPLSPGAFVSIFGGNLAPGLALAEELPLPTELNGVSVTAAGQPVALQFVAPGQINGVLPFGLSVDAAQEIVVQHGSALSTPEAVSVSQAQPAVFTQSLTGAGLGTVVGVRPDGTEFLVSPSARLRTGDVAVIYCAGLGLVDQPLEASEAAPSDPLARTLNEVSVKIGGVDATVFYAGLAPGFAGLYQINATVLDGTPAGADVPLELTVNGIRNPTVSVSVE